jgi:hypothetical protein
LGRDDAALAQGVVKKLEVGLLEQALSRTIRVGRVGDDDVEGVLVIVEELESVADMNGGLGVGEAGGHSGKVLLGQARHGLQVYEWLAKAVMD